MLAIHVKVVPFVVTYQIKASVMRLVVTLVRHGAAILTGSNKHVVAAAIQVIQVQVVANIYYKIS